MLRNVDGFGARASSEIVVQLIINRLGNEVDARIDHCEMRAARMSAFETTCVGVASTGWRDWARKERIQRDLGRRQGEVRGPRTLVGALLGHRFAREKRTAEPIGNL